MKSIEKVKESKETVKNLQRILRETCGVESLVITDEDFDLLIEKVADRLSE